MKKLLLTALAVTLISMCAFAQSDHGKKFSWGVKAGVNLANLTNSDTKDLLHTSVDVDSKIKTSVYVGLFAELPITKVLSFQPEIVYSRQGNRYKSCCNKIWQRINYLNVPLLAKINITEWFSLDLGPQFGFLLNGKDKLEHYSISVSQSSTSHYKKFDFSIAMGLSFRVANRFDISGRYNLGLTKVVKHYHSVKHRVMQFGVGYRF